MPLNIKRTAEGHLVCACSIKFLFVESNRWHALAPRVRVCFPPVFESMKPVLQSCSTPTWRNGIVRGEYSFLFFTCFIVTVEQDVQSMKLGIHCGCLSRSLASPSKTVDKTEFSTVHIVNLYCVRVQRVCKAKHHDMILGCRDVPSTRRVHLVSLWPVGTREVLFHR